MKKLIFCFDGTSNDPMDSLDFANDSSISNVLKLHLYFGGSVDNKSSSINNQSSFYYSGVGTYGGWFSRVFNSLFSPLEFDFKGIIDNASKDLEANYEDGDEIYVFGFSRGSAIARIFCAKYVKQRNVNFLGVFDTVAAIRGSMDLDKNTFPASGILFEDTNIKSHILKILHLVAIDEKRIMFQPTLCHHDERVQEVWFSGVHSDIGGGYWINGLSDITLKFMLDYVLSIGLQSLDIDDIDFKNTQITKDDIFINPQINSKIHTQKRKLLSKTLAPRVLRVQENSKTSDIKTPLVHYSVIQKILNTPDYKPSSLKDVKFRVIDDELNISDIFDGVHSVFSK